MSGNEQARKDQRRNDRTSALKWRKFDETVNEIRAALSDLSADELRDTIQGSTGKRFARKKASETLHDRIIEKL